MADTITKLQKHIDQLKAIFDDVELYMQKNQLDTIDDNCCVVNYTTDNKLADNGHVHYTNVLLTVYIGNNSDKTEELRRLGYYEVTETVVDEKLNNYQSLNKNVIIL